MKSLLMAKRRRQLTLFNTFAPAEKIYKEEKSDYHKFVNKFIEKGDGGGTKETVKVQADRMWKEVSSLVL